VTRGGVTFWEGPAPLDEGTNLSDKDVRTKSSDDTDTDGETHDDDYQSIQGDISMSHKRDRFIAQLRQLAKGKGLTFRQEEWRGKGGHAMI